MAIIKCPECGHQISDKASICPVCGVKIENNIIKCPHCGNVYLKDQPTCPVCHQSPLASTVATQQPAIPVQPQIQPSQSAAAEQQAPRKSNKNKIIAIIIAVAIIIAGGYWYASSMNSLHGDEETAYVNAMNSSDPAVLQDYLDSFKDAPQEHIDSIQAHLEILKMNDTEWTNAIISNSKTALQQYIDNHPNSLHKTEALHKIDSIDWAQCSRQNTPEAYQAYLTEHSEGEHIVEAQEKLDKLDATTVGADDKQVVNSAFQQFFRGINNNDEMGITSAVSSTLHFLTNPNATKQDVISFLHKLHKDDVRSLTWRANNDYNIKKKDMGDNTYEYDVEFTVDESVSYINSDNDKFNQYKVRGHVDSNGKISSLQLVKIG
ncbi:zinc ribbon domain-containing protein [uncultured Prevotella sp.]|uniref:zinc ribbon domain-containing protein n=1 Tax=uncultured Prevotella sp. TaxID=159272 RepID=UPI0026100262|nr:zinc ribbon domain-containing protein [uncultured Prevotella sp.]